ncbi:hypothetical protein TALK_02760 [Thalassospira alkalitolerans]|uniref:Uncharacterized protein n=1 Tax=Thalassospira alkalitolerans TaxID=1293890 RepID=A0A1Y2LH26_9PROT|nr:hypothetical protein TALK_02760 [Thalassospira alkalitolerans]
MRWRNWQVTKASVFQAFVLWDFDAFAKASSVTSTLKMQISHFDGCYRAKVLGGRNFTVTARSKAFLILD